ncbi:hypothetical protein [Mesorhizobium sp.]|uniref:hypothetical protein n=1 Tax=Mesorhizobium sp. TaxID=1871066 RepID=UPI000FE7DC98|nr:hypothetical protein [Mesorhizobium sp.]RWO57127.1 MAG: hypothetical protein EOS14_25010 [Mesorhizobium sp.]
MALEDRREAILARLLVVAAAVDTSFDARRNERGLSDKQNYVVLFDGDEHATGAPPARRSVADPPPHIMEMTSEVQFRLAGKAPDVGTALNLLRIGLISAVLTDATLLGLTLNGRTIRYEGARTATERGTLVEGGIGVAFTFTYVLYPGRVAA